LSNPPVHLVELRTRNLARNLLGQSSDKALYEIGSGF
jgi:hypothetical protein